MLYEAEPEASWQDEAECQRPGSIPLGIAQGYRETMNLRAEGPLHSGMLKVGSVVELGLQPWIRLRVEAKGRCPCLVWSGTFGPIEFCAENLDLGR